MTEEAANDIIKVLSFHLSGRITMTHSMIEEKPIKLLLSFGLPILAGSLLQQFYSMADSVIVGRGLGVNALAAVGSVSILYFLVLGFIRGLCGGFMVPIARSYGAGDHVLMRRYIVQSIILSLLASILMTILFLLGTDQLLSWMRTPADIWQDSSQYIRILFLGIPAIFFYNLLEHLLRALGDSKTPLYFLTAASILNILLDIVLILVLHVGIAGAALSNVIAQIIAGVLCIIHIIRRVPQLHLSHKDWELSLPMIRELLGQGIPLALQFSLTDLGSIILQAAVNSLGSGVVAAASIGGKLSSLLSEPACCIGVTMTTYCSQNLGAGRSDRIRLGVRQSLLIGTLYSILAGILLAFGGETIALLFFDTTETEVLHLTRQFLVANAIGYPLLSALFILRSTLQGLGHSVLSMLGGTAEMVARIAISLFLVSTLGYPIICYTNLIAWLAADLVLVPGWVKANSDLWK